LREWAAMNLSSFLLINNIFIVDPVIRRVNVININFDNDI